MIFFSVEKTSLVIFITALSYPMIGFLCTLCDISCRTDEIGLGDGEYHLFLVSASVPQKEQLRAHIFECTDKMSCTDIIAPPLGVCACLRVCVCVNVCVV